MKFETAFKNNQDKLKLWQNVAYKTNSYQAKFNVKYYEFVGRKMYKKERVLTQREKNQIKSEIKKYYLK